MRHKQAAEILREFLKKGKNRITPERFEVMDSALDYDGHFGADDLYVIMKNQKSRVSRATVYKTLELLVQCDLLSKRNFGDNMTRYESSFKRQSHDHLICMDCGRIVEFTNTSLENIPQELSKNLGFNFENYSFNIFARCRNIKTCKYYRNK
ncbi:MAG: transcriptional repressor [Ignavibacteria bacterium RIFOXYB2_FULL_35_12]|nr:MAG: transcriptional repressor [Ignavibacteria bacterium GWA2_36_19]OGU51104.1 MAG: transcriptional repressor [Ignavibacteria bacterium GWC2_35_8]OGU57104.1 MAG: transcriptional repressor [Ignavibacteria bacterium GWF2_35_20]OGU83420.1 MAG: transcriptional repressor [Ignavibacteria bacterium RIFOXYA2_FULL_35_9]OGU84799.1 MAG: transcriptional repressor [Ignavibacteria bacterium RBG_16_35_7]OGU88864.1 MAG: transcriptional repressor [Ignavibacteria bacterium RIFOXYA12_FULL_35_25]OGU90638.1 MA